MSPEELRGFEEFVRRDGGALLRAACLLVGDRDEGQDLLQTVLERTPGMSATSALYVSAADSTSRPVVLDAQRVAMIYGSGVVYLSVDGGRTWHQQGRLPRS